MYGKEVSGLLWMYIEKQKIFRLREIWDNFSNKKIADFHSVKCCGRLRKKTDKELSTFLLISLGSQFELETQLIISKHLGFLEKNKF